MKPARFSVAILLLTASSAWANDAERIVLGRIRLSTEATVAKGCTRLGRVSDDSIKDLRRKIVKVGGDTGVLSFGVEELSRIYADVYRCATAEVPVTIPPPPAGAPPPPPPGVSR